MALIEAMALIGCASLVLAWVGPAAAAQETPTWPSFQGGPAHLGSATGIRPGFSSQWRAAPEGDARLSVPVVAGTLAVSSGPGAVIGFDASTGTLLWTVARARGPIVPPALDPSAGEHGIVVYTEGADRKTSALVAIDPTTQDRLWRTALGDLSRSAPVVSDGRVFVGARDNLVYAVDLESGTIAWKARTQGQVDPSVAAAGGRVFAVSENPTSGRAALAAFRADNGKVVWTFSPSQLPSGATAPTVADGAVYVGFGDGTVRAVDAGTGAERWRAAVRLDFSPLSSPAYADGRVYLLDRAGGLYAFDGKTGKRSWDYQFDGAGEWGAPLVSQGFVAMGLDDGTVALLDSLTGHLVWQARLGAGPLGALATAGDLLLVPSIGTRGGVTAFRHDPAAKLIDRSSPTELRFGPAFLNYVVAGAVVLLVLIGAFRWLARRRPETVLADAPPPGWSPRGDGAGDGSG
jgi:outer membrane protein assembly factor BamB